MSGSWIVDVVIALIGALGLIIPGWLTYKGMKVGKTPQPANEPHGTEAWEHSRSRDAITKDGSKTRDMVAREADETRRQLQDGFRELRDQNARVPWELLATIAKLRDKE